MDSTASCRPSRVGLAIETDEVPGHHAVEKVPEGLGIVGRIPACSTEGCEQPRRCGSPIRAGKAIDHRVLQAEIRNLSDSESPIVVGSHNRRLLRAPDEAIEAHPSTSLPGILGVDDSRELTAPGTEDLAHFPPSTALSALFPLQRTEGGSCRGRESHPRKVVSLTEPVPRDQPRAGSGPFLLWHPGTALHSEYCYSITSTYTPGRGSRSEVCRAPVVREVRAWSPPT
jgi:hypothetical protein